MAGLQKFVHHIRRYLNELRLDDRIGGVLGLRSYIASRLLYLSLP